MYKNIRLFANRHIILQLTISLLTPPFHQSKMHLTSALALLSVMASAVQIGNACTELCSDAPDGVKEGSSRSSLNLLGHLNLILKLKTDNVPFCGSKIAECADDFGIMIDPNAIYTFSADGRLQKGETCVAPKKCTDSPTGATCECNPATGPIVNPASEKCLDARNLAVVRDQSIHLSVRTSSPPSDFKIANVAFIHCIFYRGSLSFFTHATKHCTLTG